MFVFLLDLYPGNLISRKLAIIFNGWFVTLFNGYCGDFNRRFASDIFGMSMGIAISNELLDQHELIRHSSIDNTVFSTQVYADMKRQWVRRIKHFIQQILKKGRPQRKGSRILRQDIG